MILEDNQAYVRKEEGIIRDLDCRCEVMVCDNEKDAMMTALSNELDLFIVDVILDGTRPGDTSGYSFMENLRQIGKYAFTPILIVTSLQDPKLYTYEHLHCYSFIEKPFDNKAFGQKVMQCLQFPGGQRECRYLNFRKDGILHVIKEHDLAYAVVSKHKMAICKKDGEVLDLPYYSIRDLLKMVSTDGFVQCNRRCVVNLDSVVSIDFTKGFVYLSGDLGKIEIGEAYIKMIKEKLA